MFQLNPLPREFLANLFVMLFTDLPQGDIPNLNQRQDPSNQGFCSTSNHISPKMSQNLIDNQLKYHTLLINS